MGWFDSLTGKSEEEPLKDLDPELRKYLQSQSPSSYKTLQESGTGHQRSYREQLGLKHNDPEQQQKAKEDAARIALTADPEQTAEPVARPLPKQSLYQDGRYAHLWSTYRPQHEIEDAGKSDQERLLDIVGGYKERQAEVGRAALENCSGEQWAVHECFRYGSWSALATMCKAENRALSRCMMMQGRFLRALGYLTMYERSEEESERIQMHADLLYQRMLKEEKANLAKKANAESSKIGDEIAEAAVAAASKKEWKPRFGDFGPQVTPLPPHRPGEISYDSLPPDVQKRVAANRLVGLEGEALELAKREVDYELAFHTDAMRQLDTHWRAEHKRRLAREEAGQPQFGDRVKQVFDFRNYDDPKSAADEQGSTAANASEVNK